MNFAVCVAEDRFPQGFAEFPRVGKPGINWRWEEISENLRSREIFRHKETIAA